MHAKQFALNHHHINCGWTDCLVSILFREKEASMDLCVEENIAHCCHFSCGFGVVVFAFGFGSNGVMDRNDMRVHSDKGQ
jgi:hypothetical protein